MKSIKFSPDNNNKLSNLLRITIANYFPQTFFFLNDVLFFEFATRYKERNELSFIFQTFRKQKFKKILRLFRMCASMHAPSQTGNWHFISVINLPRVNVVHIKKYAKCT